MANDSLKEKVAALLRLADSDSGATEAEATNAAEKAQKLCLKHGIELASISIEQNHGDISMSIENDFINIEGSGRWRRTLANTIAKSMGGDCVWIQTQGHSGKLHVFCPEGTYGSIVSTYQMLESWIERNASLEFAFSGSNVHGRTWKNSWILGAVNRIAARINENAERNKQEFVNEGHGSALIKISDDVSLAKTDEYPNIRKEYIRNTVNRDAYSQGQAAGNSADIGQTKIGMGQKSLTS